MVGTDTLDAYSAAAGAVEGVSMSLDKAIEHGKEHREPYRGAKALDYTCRNHGGCPWCEGNRKFKMRDKHPELPEEDEI